MKAMTSCPPFFEDAAFAPYAPLGGTSSFAFRKAGTSHPFAARSDATMIPIPLGKVPHWRHVTVVLLAAVFVGPSPALAQRAAPTAEEAFASAVELYERRLYADAETELASFRTRHSGHPLRGEALYLQAQSVLAQGHEAAARHLFRELQRRHPSHPQAANAQLRLAQYFLDQGNVQDAEKQLQSAIDSGSPSVAAQALYLRGATAQEQGRHEEALRYFERAYAQHPESEVAPAALYNAGAAQVRLERYDEAARSFEALSDRYPEAPYTQNVGTALAEAYFRLGSYEQVVAELENRLPQLSGEPETRALLLLAEASRQLDRGGEAVRYYERVIDAAPNSPYAERALFGLGRHQYQRGNDSDAADAFARIRSEYDSPLAERSAYYEAVVRARMGDRARAIELYRTASTRVADPRLASEATYERGLLLYQNEAYAEAADAFEALVNEYPDAPRRPDALFWLGNARLATDQYERALEAYNQADDRGGASDSLRQAARFQRGRAAYRNGQHAEAASLFASIAESVPSSPRTTDALFWAGDSHYQQGNWSQARQYFERYLDEATDTQQRPEAFYALGWTDFKLERYEAAARRFRQFLNTSGGSDSNIPYRQDARLRLADSYFALKQYDQAVEVYRQVEGEGDGYALYQSAEALNFAGRPDEAIQTLEQLVEQSDASGWGPEALYRLGGLHFQEQNYEAARDAYRRVLDTYPDHRLAPQAQYGIGDSYYNANEMNQAVEAYRAVLEEHPNSEWVEEAASSLFFALSAAGRDDEANALIDSIAAAAPGANLEDRLRFRRAEAAFQSGDSDRALSLFQNFVRTSSLEALLPQAYYYLGLLYADEESYTEATNYLRQLVDQYPDAEQHAEGALRLGDIYLEQENYEAAAEAYRSAAEGDDINDEFRGQARYGQGVALLELGRVDEAESLLNRFVEAEQDGPILALARLGLARIQEEQGATLEALDLYRRVVENDDGEAGAEALYRLGHLLRSEGRTEEAIEELDRLPTLFPGHPEWEARALLEQARAYRDRGETGQASQLYDEVLESYPGTPFAETARSEQEAL